MVPLLNSVVERGGARSRVKRPTKKCPQCGKLFCAYKIIWKYCSTKCQQKHHQPISNKRICQKCNEELADSRSLVCQRCLDKVIRPA